MVGIGPGSKQQCRSTVAVPDINRDFGEAHCKVGRMAVEAIGKPKLDRRRRQRSAGTPHRP
jgi:hypothetical protein